MNPTTYFSKTRFTALVGISFAGGFLPTYVARVLRPGILNITFQSLTFGDVMVACVVGACVAVGGTIMMYTKAMETPNFDPSALFTQAIGIPSILVLSVAQHQRVPRLGMRDVELLDALPNREFGIRQDHLRRWIVASNERGDQRQTREEDAEVRIGAGEREPEHEPSLCIRMIVATVPTS